MKTIIAANFAGLIMLAANALAQPSTVGPAPGVPDTDTQSRITNPGAADKSDRGSRSEREARDDKGAASATGDQLGPPAGVSPDEAQVRAMLEKRGYSKIGNLKEQQGIYTGTALKDGSPVQIRVDPQQAKVDENPG